MRTAHTSILRLFRKLRLLTNNYMAPDSATPALRLSYAQLFNFEQDMIRHVFLEEQILFPKLLGKSKTDHHE